MKKVTGYKQSLRVITLRLLVTVILFFLLLFTVPSTLSPSLAHMVGQPPFFKVNGQFSPYYSVPTSSLPDFNLPQDMAPTNFLIGEVIDFEIDSTLLPVPKEVIDRTTFIWDFGDGGSASGLKNSHSFKRKGSYVLTLKADAGDSMGPLVIQSVMLNIVPDKNYQLPKSNIVVNGWESKDPLTDMLESSFEAEYKFDGSKSSGGSSKIVEYFWDFGDGKSGEGPKANHRYTTNPYTVFPLLRVKTEDGFIADSFVQIKDKGALANNPGVVAKDNPTVKKPGILKVVFIGAGILVGIYLVALIFSKLKRR